MQSDTITAREAATALGCSVPTVSRMARDGRLTPVRDVPFYLFERSEVERLAAQRRGVSA